MSDLRKLSKAEMASVLRHAADRVEAGDSFEGHIGWVLAPEGHYPYGAYRFGNLDGQGSMRLLGDEEEARAASDKDFGIPEPAPAPSLVRVSYPPRLEGVIVCLDHLMQLGDADLLRGLRHDEILSEVVEFHGHRCLMCGVDAVPGRLCENVDCRRALHPQWPAVYCCNECALEDR